MARRAYVGRYAQAVFELALDREQLDEWQSDLEKIARLAEDAALVTALENPKFPFEAKAGLLSERLGDVSPLALNLACLLVSRGKLALAGDIAGEYRRLLDRHRGVERAEVLTAVPLDDAEKAKLAEHLSAITGKKVVVIPEVDASLLGGVVARVGGRLLDGSTRSKLAALRDELVKAGG